jgi:hypothetical protein
MGQHSTEPEAWDSQRGVLDILNIHSLNFKLLVVIIIELLGTGLILREMLSSRGLFSEKKNSSLLIQFLVECIILEFQFAVESLFLIIKLAFLILKA